MSEYVHIPLRQEFEGVGGRYAVESELTIPHDGREVLAVIGYAVVDRSCCGTGGVVFANVPGFIVKWRARTAPDGSPVSEVEPVADDAARKEISAAIRRSVPHCQVNFAK